jgi:hypothetical protein
MRSFSHGSLALLAGFLGVACSRHEVRPDAMSASEHRATAAEERRKAELQEAHVANDSPAYDPLSPGRVPELYLNPDATQGVTNPRLDRADRLEQRAQAHEQAAATLEQTAEMACKDVPRPKGRTCPLLGPIKDVTDVEHGVRIELGGRANTYDALPLMRCHYAHARAHGWQAGKDCAIYMPGVEFRDTGDPRTLEIIGKDDQTAAELRKHVRAGALGPTAARPTEAPDRS